MRRGLLLSGAMHGALLIAVVVGTDWLGEDDTPLILSDVDVIDGAEFDAMISTAPLVPTDALADLNTPETGQDAPEQVETPEDLTEAAEAPELSTAAAPPAKPDLSDLALPPPPRDVPVAPAELSIAEVPSPDEVPDQARTPESPPSTEPVQPLASIRPAPPAPKPAPPPEPEPAVAPEPEPEPEEPEPTETAEASPAAPPGQAPREARLPLAKPADKAAAARAARQTAQAKEAERLAKAREQERRTTPRQGNSNAPSGGQKSAQGPLNRSERNGLSLGIGRHFTPPPGMDPNVVVLMEVRLSNRGKLQGKPTMLSASGGRAGDQGTLRRNAIGALYDAEKAGVFARLPANKYDRWKRLKFRFSVKGIGVGS
ncbi:MAG: hypothetical protein AAFR17_11850 [Pseudomonadota bacterium]